jgi:two-component system response regulator YesN
MHVYVLTKDLLEAQGIKWMISSQLRDIEVTSSDSVNTLREDSLTHKIDFLIVDMDLWPAHEETNFPTGVAWLGLSSDRTFQTAYRALKHKAQDVLFRPFQPDHLIKHIQQARFHWRNREPQFEKEQNESTPKLTYTDLLLTERMPANHVLMSTISTSDENAVTQIVTSLEDFPFPTNFHVFPFSSFILCVHDVPSLEEMKDAYQSFFAQWNSQTDAQLVIYLHMSDEEASYKMLYQKMRRFHERIFFDGYDIISMEQEEIVWSEMDPFLTPIDQRFWVEMLEKRELKAIREWIEHDFLTLEVPYPDPEMVRVRLTSVLAQIRRYMIARMLTNRQVEKEYHLIFQEIVRGPVMYQIIQKLMDFITHLLNENHVTTSSSLTFSEKVRSMMESNYWNPDWNLAECAEMLRMNKSTLSRKFSQSTGKTFRDSLQEIRIREAKRLLKETKASLEEISRLTGYTHQTYFNAKFKAATGQTPSKYRFE